MTMLTRDQLNTLDHDALVFIASSLQDQLTELEKQLNKSSAQLANNNRQIEALIEQIRLMNQRRFGRSSEQNSSVDENQLNIFDCFNEAEALAKPELPEPEITEIIVGSHSRKKASGKRDADLEKLPARIIDHTLSEEELAEKFPNGYKELPYETYKRLHVIPQTFIVDEHHVHIYAAKDNSGTIIRAPRGVDLFRNSIATAPLVACILNGKYVNALPIERQAKAFKDNGVDLAPNVMANWVIKSSENYLSLIYDRMHKLLYDSRVIHADETPVKVMRIGKEDIPGGKKTYMWVYCNKPTSRSHPIILYDWQPSRHADHPREFLREFTGTVVTDGYQVYHTVAKERQDLKVSGCWVHCRRPYAEYIKSLKGKVEGGTIAQEAYRMITEIMHIDNSLDDLPISDRTRQRQLLLKEKVDAYFEWVKAKYQQVTPDSATGKALAYSINQEPYLRVFLSDGAVPMDNNRAESAIRPFTLGRKNFVIIGSSNGAKASATAYSIAETAKANHLNTYKYFELLLTEIPKHMDDKNLDFLDDLLPWSPKVQAECASQIKQSQFFLKFSLCSSIRKLRRNARFFRLSYARMSTYPVSTTMEGAS